MLKMNNIDMHEKIKILCIRSGLSVSELGRRVDKSPQNFFGKLKRGTLRKQDYQKIAEVTKCKYIEGFILENGEEI